MKKDLKDMKGKSKKRFNKKNKTRKNKGGCNCGKTAFLFGGGEIANNPSGGAVWLPGGTFYSMNPQSYNDPGSAGNTVSVRLLPQDNNTSFLIGGKKYNKTRKMKRGGGFLSNVSDFLLGPSSAFAPITSFGTTAGTVSDANTLFGNRGYVNAMPYSQPIGYKFNAHNTPMI